jgi:hypothetical protein
MAKRAFATGLLCTLLFAPLAESQPASQVIRADRNSQSLGSFCVRSDPTMRGIVRAFGRPSSCRITTQISSVATWDRLGLRVSFATFGGIRPGRTPCTDRKIWISWIKASGRSWATGLGLRAGDSVAELRSLYPRARYQRKRLGSWPAPSYWIVHYRERCYLGLCPNPYHDVPKLIAAVGDGVVRSFYLPVGAQGD